MSKIAIISDIHGNLEALRAVLDSIEQQGIDEILCLGDVVGYGPDPAECVDLVRERCRITIRGNHDDAVVHGPVNFNPLARDAINWTRGVLRPRFWKPAAKERWNFLTDLPIKSDWGEYLLVHGSPRDPTSEYIMDRDIFLGNSGMFSEIFARFETVCFVGHTHMPGIFYDFDDGPKFVPQRKIEAAFRFETTKMVVNVGSVGQPRDRDPRACFLTVDSEETFQYHRIDYDFETTRAKIHRIPDLDNQLGDRLAGGQ